MFYRELQYNVILYVTVKEKSLHTPIIYASRWKKIAGIPTI